MRRMCSRPRDGNDDLVDPVDELGPEVLADDLHDRGLHLRVVGLARELLDHL